ncbi:MAG: hypothetical protein Q8M03_07695 [Legionella sp.]|nr:hypothetical protein [Legionella sp.]
MKTDFHISIAVDALPYNKTLTSVCDYSGEQIFTKMALPLFSEKNGELSHNACIYYESSDNGKKWHFRLRNDLYWQTGELVIADDYCRAIKSICRDKSNRFRTLFFDIVGAKTYSEYESENMGIYSSGIFELTIELKYKNNFVLWFFTLINTSPLHRKNPLLTAGPYFVHFVDETHYHLKINPYYKLDLIPKAHSSIIYKKIVNDLYAECFHRNEIDVTCDTGLDLNHYINQKEHPYFQKNDIHLIMLLSPGKCFLELPDNAKTILIHAINKKIISEKFNETLKSISSYLDIYNLEAENIENKSISSLKKTFQLTISYEDFYPNRVIIDLIANQLIPFNIEVKAIEDKYGEWTSETHLRFEIRKSLRSTPFLLLKADISRGYLPETVFKEVKLLYSALLQSDIPEAKHYLFRRLDLIIRMNCIALPLFIFPTGFFCRKNIVASTLTSVGSFIHKRKGAA